MGEAYPGSTQPQAAEYDGYQQGNLSTHGEVAVAAGSGKTKEAHADGSYGSVAETLGGLVSAAGGL